VSRFGRWWQPARFGFSFRTSCPASGPTTCRLPGGTARPAFTATWQIAADLGQTAPPLPIAPPGTLINELEQLSHDLLMAAETLDRDHAGMSWAIDRVAAKQKPSSAKGMVKDCHILGHAIQLSKLLSAAGYPNSRLLVSSNRSDFAASIATVFHPDIVPDAAAAGLRYAASLEAAVADLRATGEIP
jgi:hypothetical protein